MRSGKRKACPDVAASRQAAGMAAAGKAAPNTRSNCTTSAAGRQTESESLKRIEDAIRAAEIAAMERDKKREHMKRLIRKLLGFDDKAVGAAIKCYISEDSDPIKLEGAAFEAFSIIAEIEILELEC